MQREDIEAWQNIYDQYIRKYGLSKVYKRLLQVMKEKAILECEYVITREKFKLSLIKLKEEELKSKLSNGGHGMSIEQSLIHLSKWLGYHLNEREICVTEYFNYLSEYGKANNIGGNSRK